MKRIVIGILAHVDAGKTTCIESMLYHSGTIRKMGRVDHQDAFLDYDGQERERGITIYSKEARITWNDQEIYLIDTPGHIDFSSEMERALSVLDLAVIVINGQDGVQAHTETIWKCLEHYHVPCILFVNKMDISYVTKEELIKDIRERLSDMCYDVTSDTKNDIIAMSNESVMESYLATGDIKEEDERDAVLARQCFPILFGAALKDQGVEELMDEITFLSRDRSYPEELGARVYKISEETDGTRLTHVKVTGGKLVPRMKLNEEEKIDQIRIYNGRGYTLAQEATAGMICALKGLTTFESGQGIGFETDEGSPLLQGCMSYDLVLPHGVDALSLSETCRKLAEEDPQLHIEVNEETHAITLEIMGEVQMEILKRKILEKTGIEVSFGVGRILYKETIADTVEGAGHFEPLRHYAEVHVRLEPLPLGSGIVVESDCSADDLSLNYQRQILSNLTSIHHRGVLTGSELTDVKIVLTGGKGHIKHTQGGDFRQASRRAVRQALMKAESVILEPFYSFEYELPKESLSRALYDLELKHCEVSVEELNDRKMKITGRGAVRYLINYQQEVVGYTKGEGRFTARFEGYAPSNDAVTIMHESYYDPDSDLRNPSGSVFCANGSGYFVPWDEADALMHVEVHKEESQVQYHAHSRSTVGEEELQRVFAMTYGRNQNEKKQAQKKPKNEEKPKKVIASPHLPKCLLVDGYNMLFAWEEYQDLARENISVAREKLVERIASYQTYIGYKVIIVFDGYKVKDNMGTVEKRNNNLEVVYTRTDETADAWLEKTAHDYRRQYEIEVATSDALIQNAIFAQGALRVPARELLTRIEFYESLTKEGVHL